MALSGGFQSGSEAIPDGMTRGFANTVMLGIPLVLTAYGEAGAVPLFIIISLHSILLIGSATMLIEIARGDTATTILPEHWPRDLTNPIIAGLLLGLAANMQGFTNGAGCQNGRCCAAAVHARYFPPVPRRRYRSAAIGGPVVVGFAGWPSSAGLAVAPMFDVPALWRDVAVLLSLPVGINVHLLAARYHAGEARGPVAGAVGGFVFPHRDRGSASVGRGARRRHAAP